MSDHEGGPKGKNGWTDRELLVYLFALVEHSGVKFDYHNTPRPAGRTVRACSQRIDKLKNTLKDDLELLKSGQAIDETTPKKVTPRKRKAKTDVDGSGKQSPKKSRGGAKKDQSKAVVKEELEDEVDVEAEIEDDT